MNYASSETEQRAWPLQAVPSCARSAQPVASAMICSRRARLQRFLEGHRVFLSPATGVDADAVAGNPISQMLRQVFTPALEIW